METVLSLLALAAGFFGPIITEWLKGRASVQTAKADGAATADAAANKESADAQTRMAGADAQPRNASIAIGRLRDGSA
jgi:hypothetical protein